MLGAQAAALVGVHIVDKLRKERVPHVAGGFPTFPPLDTQVEGTEVRTYTEGTSLYEDMLEAITSAKDYIFFESYIWREDEVGPTLDRDEVLAQAPAQQDGMFLVPQILEED